MERDGEEQVEETNFSQVAGHLGLRSGWGWGSRRREWRGSVGGNLGEEGVGTDKRKIEKCVGKGEESEGGKRKEGERMRNRRN